MVRAWNENSFADSVLLICNTAAPASALIPGCGASAASAVRSAGVSPISPKATSPKAVLAHRNVIMSLPPKMDDVHCCKTKLKIMIVAHGARRWVGLEPAWGEIQGIRIKAAARH